MSVENEAAEKETIIDIQEEEREKTSQTNSENSVLAPPGTEHKEDNSPKFVEKKSINSLSEDERAHIIANAKAEVDQPYFNVKFYKNGKTTITKKKETPQTVSKKNYISKSSS